MFILFLPWLMRPPTLKSPRVLGCPPDRGRYETRHCAREGALVLLMFCLLFQPEANPLLK
jgi:hypothetical protein